jgi:hypothetical protein
MPDRENQRYTRKGELVKDVLPARASLTGEFRRKNPYKTPPNNLTTKNREILRGKGGDGQ